MDFFIAIDRRGLSTFSPEKLESLTPRIMQWSEEIWLLDMGLCLTYWWKRAAQENIDVVTLWRLALQRIFQGESFIYGAAVARHPWQAILLLGHMRERQLSGLVDYDSVFGRRHFQEVTWRNWWSAAKSIIPHFSHAGRKKLTSFPRSLGQMRRAIKRLRVDRPYNLKTAEPSAIRRRFGSVMGELWEWTYGGQDDRSLSNQLANFPWRSYCFRQPPAVHRNLEFTLWDWEQMAPLLQQDLNALCADVAASFAMVDRFGDEGICQKYGNLDTKEYVLRLVWRLHLADGRTQELELPFRNPHNLHQDAPEQRTALAQALFRFSGFQGELEDVNRDFCLGVIAWEVIVAEKMAFPPHTRSLFDDPTGDMQELANLENLLPVPLEHLETKADWVAEHAYGPAAPVVATKALSAHAVSAGKRQDEREALVFQAAANQHPLFIFETPESLLRKGESRGLRFLERTMEKWWLKDVNLQNDFESEKSSPYRDYYQLYDGEGKSLWVFQNQRRQWFVQGIYG